MKTIAVVLDESDTRTADKKQLQNFYRSPLPYAFYRVGFEDLSTTTITLATVNIIARNVHTTPRPIMALCTIRVIACTDGFQIKVFPIKTVGTYNSRRPSARFGVHGHSINLRNGPIAKISSNTFSHRKNNDSCSFLLFYLIRFPAFPFATRITLRRMHAQTNRISAFNL